MWSIPSSLDPDSDGQRPSTHRLQLRCRPGLPQQQAIGLSQRQPLQSEPLVPLSVGSRSSEKATGALGTPGVPPTPARAGRCCGLTSAWLHVRSLPTPPLPRTPAPGRVPGACWARSLVRSSPWRSSRKVVSSTWQSLCHPPFPMLITPNFCGGHIHITLSVLRCRSCR